VLSYPPRKGEVKIRGAVRDEVQEIHRVLSESFETYRISYTQEAYNATVVSPEEIQKRIDDPAIEVLVAVYDDEIVGTATISLKGKEEFYIASMGVRPATQGKGTGRRILEEIQRRARQKKCKTISLECYEPLGSAIKLYERFGFRRTGRKRAYHGIEIFEMKKETNPRQIE
jgi:ribosomal protein S18 acetylase RimI-like enzyme